MLINGPKQSRLVPAMRRVEKLWHRRLAHVMAAMLVLACYLPLVLHPSSKGLEHWMVVRDIVIKGNDYVDRQDIRALMSVEVGQSLFDVSPKDMRSSIQNLGWIKDATVERLLVGTIRVQVRERIPYAQWYNWDDEHGNSAPVLVDRDGHILGPDNKHLYGNILTVFGAEALENLGDLQAINMALRLPDHKIVAATYTGSDRWDIRLHDGIIIHLPNRDPVDAWQRLAQAERNYGILRTDIASIDLRLKDRLIVGFSRLPSRPSDRRL